jgi:fermentation-respiration switch protein FrsA (DUF1100 family)
LRSKLLRVSFLLLGGAALIVLGLRWLEPGLVFVPERGPVGAGPGQTVRLRTADGVQLVAWWCERPAARGSVLYLHGNGGNLRGRESVIERIGAATQSSVLALDWRGYGESEGEPSEAGLYADARAGWDWLAERCAPARIVIWGESLGGAPATWLAEQVAPRGLVLQSTFTSVPDMSFRVVPLPGVRWLCSIGMNNLERVPRIRCWKLFVHSRADEVVPFSMAERLYAAACEPKVSVWLERFGHNDAGIAAELAVRLAPLFAQLP